jgi:fermentation-respiration switch protein FrsA (DUF1100 family)
MALGLVLLAIYLGLVGTLFFYQRVLLYPGSGRQATVAEAGLAGFEDVVIATRDGERLVAWWKPPSPGKALLLYFHGNGGSLWNRRDRARIMTQTGRGLLMVSYRGYSGSTGSPSEEGLRLDAQATYDWAARYYEPPRLVLYGESLGTGVAVRLATERRTGGLVLDAPYTSIADVASLTYWFVPVSWLMRDQYRSMDVIGQVQVPILMLHGEGDGVIPIALGEQLHAAAPEPKRFVRFPNVGHASVLESGGIEVVDAFLAGIEAALPIPPPEAAEPSRRP